MERAKEVLAPFPIRQVGLVLDPPNFITPALYPKREEEMGRLFRELGDRVHLVHLKDLKLNRPLPCIIEHINAERSELTKARAWIENQLHRN